MAAKESKLVVNRNNKWRLAQVDDSQT